MPCICRYCGDHELYTIQLSKTSQVNSRNMFFGRVNKYYYYDVSLENLTNSLWYEIFVFQFCVDCKNMDSVLVREQNTESNNGFISSNKKQKTTTKTDKYICNECCSNNLLEIRLDGYNLHTSSINKSIHTSVVQRALTESALYTPHRWLNELYFCGNTNCCYISTNLLEWVKVDEDKYIDAPWDRELEYLELLNDDYDELNEDNDSEEGVIISSMYVV